MGVENGDFLAYYNSAKGILATETDVHERAEHLISHYGLTGKEAIEAMKRHYLLHEFGHVLGIKGTLRGERLQGELQAEFYTMLANNFKGTKWEKIYRALARDRLNYAEHFSLKNLLLGKLKNPFEGSEQLERMLLEKFVGEADALEISEDEKAAYIRSRFKDIYKDSGDEAKSHKTTSKKSNSKDLEARVREDPKETRSDKAEANDRADSKESPSEAAE